MEGLVYLHNTFHHIDWLNGLVRFITHLGDVGFVWLVLAFILFWSKKTRKCAIVLVVSLAMGYVFNNLVLKNIFDRARPFTVNEEFKNFILNLGMELPEESSFPSGHAFSSFSSATIILLFSKRMGLFACILAFLISFSRIYLCVHYPTDVLAGVIFGIMFATMVYFTFKVVEKKFENNKRNKLRKDNV